MCLQSPMGKKSCVYEVLDELLSMKNESWKKYKKSLKIPGISFYCFGTNPERHRVFLSGCWQHKLCQVFCLNSVCEMVQIGSSC